jgi:hypothetical protein
MRDIVPACLFGRRARFLVAVWLALAAGRAIDAADHAGIEFFEKRVRPILMARCYECHSEKAEKVKGGLRLDSRSGALKGGDTGPAVIPGKPKESPLIDAINYGELYQMPPKSRLPADEIAALTKWVEMGAPWPEVGGRESGVNNRVAETFDLAKRKAEHWCWQPIKAVSPPTIENPKLRIQNPIDSFILAKLSAAGLSPAAPAEPGTLIRRAYFDLLGLPPPANQVEAFVAISPSLRHSVAPSDGQDRETERQREGEAYAALIDRLLASPQFGERWARHWLDLVRYAESRGHEFDYNTPNAFEYRDYVIRALNGDLPYDQFVIEQVAGDLLPEPRLNPRDRFNESIIGTGFWFLSEWCHSPVDIRKDECDRIDNMLDVFSKTFLGVTVACARCHDHKFDAISQRDYYALAGYLQSSSYRLARFETWEQDRQIAQELAALEAKYRPQIAAAVAKAGRAKHADLARALAVDAEKLKLELGVLETDLRGAHVIVDYSNVPAADWMTDGPTWMRARPGQLALTGDEGSPLEVVTTGAARRDPAWGDLGIASTSENDPGRLNGWLRAGRTLKTPTFTLKSGYVHYLIEGAGQVYAAVGSHYMNNGPLHTELIKDTGGNSDLPTRWITHDLRRYIGERLHLEFTPKEDEDFRILMVVDGQKRPAAPTMRTNRFLEAALARSAETGRSTSMYFWCREAIILTLQQLAKDQVAEDSNASDISAIASWLVSQILENKSASREIRKLTSDYSAARETITERIRRDSRLCLAMWDGTTIDENVLIRGNHKTIGPVVQKRLPEALPQPPMTSLESLLSDRLDLAQKLVDRSNPLVARVIVNRVWQHLMGRGIVPSVDNFGVLGQPPTHPELLDYLADEFVRDGWSLKRLIRRIMLSDTYQMASGGRQPPEAEGADPENLLFHLQNLKRLEGEAIRDAILAVSGRLDGAQYGPSVPIYLTPFMQGRGRPKESGPLDGAGRRSVYIAVRRNFISPMMQAFDTPIPFSTIGRRNVSNVPAQALILLNDPFIAEQSRIWGNKLLASSASPHDRIRQMYVAAFSREPTAAETDAGMAFLDQQARDYSCSPSDERVWADLAHVLFNVKEFVLVE